METPRDQFEALGDDERRDIELITSALELTNWGVVVSGDTTSGIDVTFVKPSDDATPPALRKAS